MGIRRFRSAGNLERWADNLITRIVRSGADRARLVGELVATVWRDGYRCGRLDRDEEIRAALGIGTQVEEVPVEPLNGAERMQRGTR